jgi:hypothetical protein
MHAWHDEAWFACMSGLRHGVKNGVTSELQLSAWMVRSAQKLMPTHDLHQDMHNKYAHCAALYACSADADLHIMLCSPAKTSCSNTRSA